MKLFHVSLLPALPSYSLLGEVSISGCDDLVHNRRKLGPKGSSQPTLTSVGDGKAGVSPSWRSNGGETTACLGIVLENRRKERLSWEQKGERAAHKG